MEIPHLIHAEFDSLQEQRLGQAVARFARVGHSDNMPTLPAKANELTSLISASKDVDVAQVEEILEVEDFK